MTIGTHSDLSRVFQKDVQQFFTNIQTPNKQGNKPACWALWFDYYVVLHLRYSLKNDTSCCSVSAWELSSSLAAAVSSDTAELLWVTLEI